MVEWSNLGKVFIWIGGGIVLVGTLMLLADRVPSIGHLFSWLGKMPGDISIKRDHFAFYFPLGTSIFLSILLSLVFYVLSWMFRR
jgi:hypothetical protein